MKSKVQVLVFTSLVLILFGFNTHTVSYDGSEEKGILFTTASFADAKAEAAKTGKLIFIDVYASWCGPCKLMAKNSFTNSKVGDRYNTAFINLKLDAEKTQDGMDASRRYAVNAYPTLLFVNAEGELIRKFVGYKSPEELLQIADFAMKK